MITPQTVTGEAGQQQAHDQAIEAIAKESHAAIDRVRELYEAEHARLAAQARIKTFLSVIATRLVRTALHETQHASIQ